MTNFTKTYNYTLPLLDGQTSDRTVYIWLKTKKGNVSQGAFDSITLLGPPVISVTSNTPDGEYAFGANISVKLNFNESVTVRDKSSELIWMKNYTYQFEYL